MPVTESHPLSVHEVALNKLKRPTTTTTTANPNVQAVPKTTASSGDKNANKNVCKHFEFQCHTVGNEGGCIGIYNVCDGIPQCEDSSDEIDCPPAVIASNTKIVKPQEQRFDPQANEISMKVKPYQLPENTNSNRMQVQQQLSQVQNQLPMIIPNSNNREDPLTSPKLAWQNHQGSNENIQYQGEFF